MKKLNLILIMLSLALFSCENSSFEQTTEDVNQTKIKNVKLLKGENQKIAFRLLSNDSKVKLWDDKFQDLLLSTELIENQITMIEEIKSLLSESIYDKTSPNHEEVINEISEWSERAQENFTKSEFVEYFGSLSARQDFTHIEPDDGGNGDPEGSPSCDCSFSSNHCGAFWENVDCVENKDNCVDRSMFGCGTLLAYDCDGLCDE